MPVVHHGGPRRRGLVELMTDRKEWEAMPDNDRREWLALAAVIGAGWVALHLMGWQ